MIWEKIEKSVIVGIGTTITYRAKEYPMLIVQSRKRHIPHANGVGTWEHTSYFVIWQGKEIKECYSLKDAKAAAEKLAERKEA